MTKLSLYIAKIAFTKIMMVILVLAVLIYLIDLVDIFGRASDKDIPFGRLFVMSFLKLPSLLEKIFPFAILIGTALTYTRLTKTQELVIARVSGVSVWQFLMPTILLGLILGVISTTVINPLSGSMFAEYSRQEAKYLKGRINILSVSASGLWLKQKEKEGAGEYIIRASKISQKDRIILSNPTFYYYDGFGNFAKRIDAKNAVLQHQNWKFKDPLITTIYPTPTNIRPDSEFVLKTNISDEDITNSYAKAETIGFWQLPSFIKTLDDLGFNSIKHKLHWHEVLAYPLFFCAMVLLASLFSLRYTRKGGIGYMIALSLLVGFMVYFVNNLINTMGLSGTLPMIVAIWLPLAMIAMLSIGILTHTEDG